MYYFYSRGWALADAALAAGVASMGSVLVLTRRYQDLYQEWRE